MATVQVTTEQRWGYRLGRRGVRNLQSPACPADALPTARGVGEGIKTTGGSDTARGCKRQKTELLQAQISCVQALELGHGKPGWAPPPAVPAGWESPTCGKLTALRPNSAPSGATQNKGMKTLLYLCGNLKPYRSEMNPLKWHRAADFKPAFL